MKEGVFALGIHFMIYESREVNKYPHYPSPHLKVGASRAFSVKYTARVTDPSRPFEHDLASL